MKHLRVVGIILFALWCCQKNEDISEYSGTIVQTKASSSFDQDHSLTDFACNVDIFELSQVQHLLDSMDESDKQERLQPTHYVLKIQPQSESEFFRYFDDTTKTVSQIPFGRKRNTVARDDDSWNGVDSFPQEVDNRWGCDAIADDLLMHVAPLFVRWPVSEPLPVDTSYEIQYEEYIPAGSSRLDSLIRQHISESSVSAQDTNRTMVWRMQLKAFDPVLNTYIPIRNAQISVIDDASLYYLHLLTDSLGRFTVPNTAPDAASVTLTLRNPSFFYIGNEGLISVVQENLGTFGTLKLSFDPVTKLHPINLSYEFERQVYQSAWYYYHGSNSLLNIIPKIMGNSSDELRVAVYPFHSSLSYQIQGETIVGVGWFLTGNSTPPYIEICNYASGTYRSSKIFGTTLHELGHASHFVSNGTSYHSTEKMVKESFASFSGWYNAYIYYFSVVPGESSFRYFTTQHRQYWYSDNTDSYTPVFVDLSDIFNQYGSYNPAINDAISGVPVSTIIDYAFQAQSWSDVYSQMLLDVGSFFSSTEFLDFTSAYSVFL